MDRCAVLDAAGEAVGEGPDGRGRVYGPADAGLGRIAALWSADLGIALDAADVARLLALLKIARVRVAPGHADSWVDVAGYAALGAELAGARRVVVAVAAVDDGTGGLAAELEQSGLAPDARATLAELIAACDGPVVGGRGPELTAVGAVPPLTPSEVQQARMLRQRHWAAKDIALWLEVDEALVEAAIAAAPDCEPVPGLAVIMEEEAADPVADPGDPVAENAGAVAETTDPVGEIADPVADPGDPDPQPDPEPEPEPDPDEAGGAGGSAADMRGRSGWSDREDLALLEAFGEGKRAAEVAQVVGRTQAAVAKRFGRLVPERRLTQRRKALAAARARVAQLDAAAADAEA